MAAPRQVRSARRRRRVVYDSPRVVPSGWQADRPADLRATQPSGPRLGDTGPDQGYALTLTGRFDDRLRLAQGEVAADVHAGCVEVAMKRASLFGRAPVIYDLEVAYTIWGYFDAAPPPELVEVRRRAFEGAAEAHHYTARRKLAAMVRPAALELPPADAVRLYEADWRQAVSQLEEHNDG